MRRAHSRSTICSARPSRGSSVHPIVHEYKYIGVIAIVLALTAVVFRFRQPEVAALAVVVVVTGIVVFVPAAISVINALPGLHAVRLPRALNFFTFGVAMLSAVGLQVFLRSPGNRSVIKFIAAAFGVAAAGTGRLLGDRLASSVDSSSTRSGDGASPGSWSGWPWACRRGGRCRRHPPPLAPRACRCVRGSKATSTRRYGVRLWTATALLGAETIFLIVSGMGLWTSSSTPFAPTPASLALKRAVGSDAGRTGHATMPVPARDWASRSTTTSCTGSASWPCTTRWSPATTTSPGR